MNHHQLSALKGGERIKVWRYGQYQKATFIGHIRGADPAAWIAFDKDQVISRGPIAVRLTTGLQFTEEYWNEQPPKFLLLTDEELNAELIENMGVMG